MTECAAPSAPCNGGAASVRAADASVAPQPACVFERDRLAMDTYHAVLRSGRGDWLELLNYAPLASQHHLSAYSLLKFGGMGTFLYRPPLWRSLHVLLQVLHMHTCPCRSSSLRRWTRSSRDSAQTRPIAGNGW